MGTFTINGKEYKAKPFDFNLVCDLEDMGISLEKANDKPMSMIRAYFSFCAGKGKEFAGREIENHVKSGGSFEDITNAMSKEMESSDFFRALQETAETQESKAEEATYTAPQI